MVVQHNLTAMNSNRMLGLTTSAQAKSTEKLSSGYKINRAADDAAGLSISEKMRKQIRGLTQASLNAQDGISAVQTAEGALNEVQDMLQRANELAVKAANGTMSENDRSYIQDEIKALETEIDRVAETTKFNETYLLKGDKTADAEYAFSYYKGTATIVDTNTALYREDGTTIAGDEELLEYLVEDAENKVYTTAPKDGVEAVKGTDYSYTEAKAVAATAKNTNLYKEGSTTVVADGQDASALLNASADGSVDPTLKTGIYKDSTTTGTLSNGSTGDTTSTKSDAALKFFKEADGSIISIAAGDDAKDGTTQLIAADGTVTAGYKLVEAAALADFTVTEKGAPSSATKTAANLYDEDGNALANDAAIKTYLDADPTKKIYTEKPVDGVEATIANYTSDIPTTKPQFYDKDGNKIAENALSNYFETTDGTTVTQKKDTTLYDEDGNVLELTADDISEALATPEELVGALTLKLHVGADATTNNQISIDLHAMSAKGLGIDELKVDGADDTNALAAIDTIKEAIQKVSTQRSALGAIQNRLEHTIANLDNVVENTTAAESQIRDTDMATEMVKYSNNNILAQAGQAMLAQANQSNQGVLALLG